MTEFEAARREAAAILDRMDKLDPRVQLYIHREVCRRAQPIYAAMYGAKQEHNYRAAAAGLAARRARLVQGTTSPLTERKP